MFRENETPEVLSKGTPGFRPSRWNSFESLAERGHAMLFAMLRALILEATHAAASLSQPHPTPSEAT
jgi:hypothetical protein